MNQLVNEPAPQKEPKTPSPFLIDKKEVGKRIKVLRDKKDLTQLDLSKLVEKSRAAIAQWENGDATPDLTSLTALAFFLNTTPQYIAFGIMGSNEESYRVPVMDYTTHAGDRTGEMSLDLEFYKSLHLPASAVLRAVRLPRDDMMAGFSKGSVIIIDEADKALVGAGEAFLIFHKVPAVAYIDAVPGHNGFSVRIGDQKFPIEGGLPVIGRVVAAMKSFV
jgi:transcriptional regulator with XRE-family HTH domain